MAAAEKAVLASCDDGGYSGLTVMVSHLVSIILLEQKNSHMSAASVWLGILRIIAQ